MLDLTVDSLLRRHSKVDVDIIDDTLLPLQLGELMVLHTDAACHTAEDHTHNRSIKRLLAEKREPSTVILKIFAFRFNGSKFSQKL